LNSKQEKIWVIVFASWCVALVATVGSLFFSEVMQLPPCVLCWYQRIAMYPLVIVLLLGLFPLDMKAVRSAFVLSLIGLSIAIYHNLLYYHVIPESMSPCTKGISCTTVQLQWLGFITIPLLSLVAFILIVVLCALALKKEKYE
jgi:disulfide bond formation protein DsbB